MEREIFTPNQSQAIVDAILKGYKSYLDERIEKRKSMHVSAGYAWTKANHIDDALAVADLTFIDTFELKHAGQSWEFLEFNSENQLLGRVCFVLKGLTRLQQVFPTAVKSGKGYLFDYAQINTAYLENLSRHTDESTPFPVQMELFDDNLFELLNRSEQSINNFFFITYQADELHHLTNIQVIMPDSRNGKLIEIQDLSAYISTSSIDFSDEKYQELQGLSEIDDVADFEIIPRLASEKEA
ncbi:TPA: hypothetical protein U0K44_000217 [Streptococcus suis]|uniref:spr1630 family ClpXP-sensitive toxin n=1 Tax=Streptococcus suis TaxID=1307 RepID=UPI001581B2B9|nr:hypothetical protein [Streptococcus suis]HEL9633415.1 hypothetical protein [Streptococcus suis]